ncbi:cellulase family glycosylhydrolase [Acrocarpospora catenulata]|uniref:cellulase family glycosylhydrolase n=1 Tax=Acrocarpospora catenulata TaxID=2836182 RepID=UPI001BD9C2EF|nr:cellulase family glycosylhydrolase [Acrocarpospora catenulata]
MSTLNRLRRRRSTLAATAAVVLAAVGLVATSTAANAAIACSVTYTKAWDNGSGFGANVTITNLGDPVNPWTLRFAFPGNQQVSNGWGGTWSQSGQNVTVVAPSYAPSLGTGGSTTIGFNGTYSGTNTNPGTFSINNVTCTGSSPPPNTPPTVSLTSPTNGQSYGAPATIALAATASDSDGSVTSVAFYNGSTLLGTDTTSPYTFSWTNVAAGSYSLTARATDNGGATTTSTAVNVTVLPVVADPIVVVSPTAVTVPEGGTATVSVRLSRAPTSNATVTTTRVSGDTDLTVASGGTLTFTTANWNMPQNVTIAAAEDADTTNGTANFTSASPNYLSGTFTATEADNDTATGAAPALHVEGNRIVTSSGATYRLLGVNRSGGEFACIQGNGIWDGPMDQASVTAMRSWKIRTVRVPLNEQCWLGVAPVQAQYGGTSYQNAVKTYVNLLIANGITPIVEMHWNYGQYTGNSSGCSDVNATCQKPMPDAQYAPSFWTGVANAFKGNDAVILDLFNEPYPERATGSTTTGWACWKNGGTCPGISYQVAGFQSLVNTVRATGATNIIMIGGLAYSNDLTGWLANKPTDPLNNLAAFAHIYNFNSCANTSCYDSQLAPVAAAVPLSLTEIGENDCAHSFIDTLMNWADAHGVGYLGWTWNTWPCTSGPALITDYNGTATAFGQGLKTRLATVSN